MRRVFAFITTKSRMSRIRDLGTLVLLLATLIPFVRPMLQGLILLPLDLLVSNFSPWSLSGQILLKNPYMQDSIAQMYPWKQLVFESFRHGIIPFWNPYQFTGMPFMAGAKPMVFYPLSLLGLFGDITGWNMLLISQFLLSLCFMYLCARSLSMSRSGSILSAITFTFSSLMIGVLEFGSEGHVILWLPFILFSIKRLVDTKKSLFMIGITIGTTMSVLAGQLQYTAYMLLFSVSFAFFYRYIRRASWKYLAWIGVSIALAIGVSAPQLGPSMEMFAASARNQWPNEEFFLRGLIPAYKLFRFFSPDYFGNPITGNLTIGYIESSGYIGILSLVCIVYAAFSFRSNSLVRFFFIAALVSMTLSLRGIGNILSVLHFPLITSGSGERIIVIALFCGAILAGFGIDHIARQLQVKKLLLSFVIIGMAFLCSILFSLLFLPHLDISSKNSLLQGIRFPAIIFLVGFIGFSALSVSSQLLRKNFTIILVLMIVGVTYIDLFRMSWRFLTYSNPKFLYPETPVTAYLHNATAKTLDRTLGAGGPEIETAIKIYSAETYNPLYSRMHARLMTSLLGTDEENLAATNKMLLPIGNESMKYALDILGIRYVVMPKDANPSKELFASQKFSDRFTKVFSDERNDIFENIDAIPRFGLRYDIQNAKNDTEALEILKRKDTDFSRTVILTGFTEPAHAVGSGSATLVSYGVNTANFRVTSTSPTIFYLSDSYDSGWHADVNGIQTKIYRANYDFRAIEVPQGTSDIHFWYEPKNFRIYLGVSIASLSVLVLGLILIVL